MNHHNLQYALEEAPFEPEGKAIAPAGVSGKIEAWGATVPTAGSADYAPGCIFHHTDGGAGTGVYINEGTATSCSFVAVTTPGNIATQVDTAFPVSGSASGRGPSPLIWDTCPVLDYFLDPTDGQVLFNDFQGDHALGNNQTATALGSGVMGFTGASANNAIGMDATDANGAIKLTATNDNEAVGIALLSGKNTAGGYVITSGKKSWFECRLKFNNITDAKYGAFIGFAEEALLAENGTLVDAGTMADKDYLGFLRVEGDGDKLDIVYNTAGGGAAVEHAADAATIVKDTYTKIGWYCDGTTITFYQDGVAIGTALTVATAEVPDGEEMAFYVVVNCAHDDDAIITVDWARIAREF